MESVRGRGWWSGIYRPAVWGGGGRHITQKRWQSDWAGYADDGRRRHGHAQESTALVAEKGGRAERQQQPGQDKSDLVGDGANRHHTQSTEAAVRGAKQADGKQYGRQPVPLRPTIPKSGDARAPVHRTGPSSTGWLPSSASASQRLYGFGFDNPGNAGSLLGNLVRSGW